MTLPYGQAYLNQLINQQSRSIKREGHEYTLTKDQHQALLLQDCHYCGVAPNRLRNPSIMKKTNTPNGHVLTNGIDRADNDLGYTPENSRTACWECNKAKGSMSEPQFVELCRTIAARFL
jgi:5-methylcytosine-specific restriction endonuclease McrA